MCHLKKGFDPLVQTAQNLGTESTQSIICRKIAKSRIFDETNCDELTPEGIQTSVMELRAPCVVEGESDALRADTNRSDADDDTRLERLGMEDRSKVSDRGPCHLGLESCLDLGLRSKLQFNKGGKNNGR